MYALSHRVEEPRRGLDPTSHGEISIIYLLKMSKRRSESERPLGVKVLAGLAWVTGGAMVVMSMGILFSFSEVLSGFEFLGGLIVVVGLLYIAYGVGLWTTESWGWWTGMITNGIAVLSSFTAPVFLVVSLAVMAYLYSMRELFEITF